MKAIALFLAGALLTSPEDKPAIPDYFNNGGTDGQSAISQCNLNGEDVSGPFKTCRYDCGRTLTVGERSVCPFVLQQ